AELGRRPEAGCVLAQSVRRSPKAASQRTYGLGIDVDAHSGSPSKHPAAQTNGFALANARPRNPTQLPTMGQRSSVSLLAPATTPLTFPSVGGFLFVGRACHERCVAGGQAKNPSRDHVR